jgi:hypothetical protein
MLLLLLLAALGQRQWSSREFGRSTWSRRALRREEEDKWEECATVLACRGM